MNNSISSIISITHRVASVECFLNGVPTSDMNILVDYARTHTRTCIQDDVAIKKTKI